MKANFDRLIGGAVDAAKVTRERGGTAPSMLAIAISCVGRRLVLGERTEEEIEATLEALPAGTQQVGFYSYGELCPQNDRSCCGPIRAKPPPDRCAWQTTREPPRKQFLSLAPTRRRKPIPPAMAWR